ncbi:Acg family FMN-binding oxidoreductase [Haloechinothrix sp. LS1_15]|uniref:Acg family FMN-binding oxidoreductase n=1 Tax=Haloechinothrix sp. LS1_15 TaxID=2652248 RepID=UPI00294B849E|nr:nitroreductase family protein [Haloechinothrix sp. LS1_15]
MTALKLAGRAPSIHNTQPWMWRIGHRTVHLYADPAVQLAQADPDRRNLVISCGIVLHHLRVALAALGWQAVVHRLPNPADPDHLASVELRSHSPSEEEIALAAAITHRRTDRRYYSSWPVPPSHSSLLASRAADEGVAVRTIREHYLRRHVIDAIAEAARSHSQDLSYQLELARWSGRRGSPSGVPARNTPSPDQQAGALPARAFADPQLEQQPEYTAAEDAGILLILATLDDEPISLLRAGEATSAVMLTATSLGLANCPLTEALEVNDTRQRLREDTLGDSGCPQMILRVGWAPINADPLPPTPRHPIADLLIDADAAVSTRASSD